MEIVFYKKTHRSAQFFQAANALIFVRTKKAAHIICYGAHGTTMMHVRQVPCRQTLGVDICHTPSVSTTYMYAEGFYYVL
jgi:uncharacterized protein involved in response to NO